MKKETEGANKHAVRTLLLTNMPTLRKITDASHVSETDVWKLVPAIDAEAEKFVKKSFDGDSFIALHIKRDDEYREKHSDLYFSEDELVGVMMEFGKKHNIFNFFLATTEKNEVMYLRKKLEREVKDEDSGVCSTDGTCPAVQLIGYKRRPSTGFKGLQVGYVEQRVAAAATHFIAAAESQFSKAIHSRRVKLKLQKKGSLGPSSQGC